jgi:predicted Zn finger-like uncharacterized protein
MLQVECESCKAPYQIDERRVPPAGLKMRCPKCGHSFMVTDPASARAGKAAAPAVASSQATGPSRPELPSDFPAALGSLDEPDLPVVSADLPAARSPAADLPAMKKAPPRPPPKVSPAAPSKPVPPASAANTDSFGNFDLDLPSVHGDLPAARPGASASTFDIDLPTATKADLPSAKRNIDFDLLVVAADLPATAASLPAVAAGLPSPAASLPSVAAGLPLPASPVGGFGEIDLPTAAESLLASLPRDHNLPAHPRPSDSGEGSFGEIDLPRDPPIIAPSVNVRPSAAGVTSADFGDLELDEKPRSQKSISGRPSALVESRPSALAESSRGGGGMAFGEVDLTSGQSEVAATPIGVEASSRGSSSEAPAVQRPTGAGAAAATAQVRSPDRAPAKVTIGETQRKAPIGKRLAVGAVVVAVLAGAALQLTTYGAFGYLYVLDRVNEKNYDRATSAAIAEADKAFSADTYDNAKAAVDAAAGAHVRVPRDKSLTAYAALVDFATTMRFGPDTGRASRAKQFLAELAADQPVKYRDVALAAQAATNDDLQSARKGLDAASTEYARDAIENEVALLRGEVGLAAIDGPVAVVAFKRALELANDARAHFGLARAYDMLTDAVGAKKEIDATLAASPQHPGALTLRARMKSAPTDEATALKDLSTVLDGPSRAKASPIEVSRAYAARAWVDLERGTASEAREAFARAVSIDPRNVGALRGEGRLLMNEGRYTEALARFDTTLQLEPGSPEAIADDAEAKLALERLGDAKKQLAEARQRFPTSMSILLLLGKVEQHLGNKDAAEADLRTAVAMVSPLQRDAVRPYVALSELLSSRGRLTDAKAILSEAKKRLAPSAALDRALGEVAELQGEHEVAIAQYRAAIARDPRDAAAHFRLAVTLRRVRKLDEAGAELDQVAAVDKDYPGLSLERGLLFEESGEVAKAIEQFSAALARAPEDPDLQLRVGSAYVAIGRPDDAIPMLRKVLQGRPTSAEAHHYLGRALMLKGPTQQGDALRYLKRAVDLDPNRAEFHVYVAWAANEAVPAQLELARDEIDKAMALDKLDAEIYWQKGVLERMEGAIEDAIKDEKRALELRPSRYEAHATLAECYEDRNDEPAAMGEWAKAIAGDAEMAGGDGSVRHPYWRYKYGKLLMTRGNAAAALPLLLPAVTTVEKSEQRPGWLAPLEFFAAEALRKAGRKNEAVEHYRRFLDVAPVTSPDRADAQAALARLTGER